MTCSDSSAPCGCYLGSSSAALSVAGIGTEADPFMESLVLSAAAEQGLQVLGDGLWGPQGVPPGVIAAFGGSSIPTGWLLCDGTAVSRTTYGALFGAIGTAYGPGDGSSTFNLPDLRARAPVGMLAADPNFPALGSRAGEATHTLTEAELASHNHTGSTGGQGADHSHNLTTAGGGAHSHSVAGGDFGDRILITFTPSSLEYTNTNPSGTQQITYSHLDADAGHSHTGSTAGTSNDHLHGIPSDGSGAAHNNIQPSLAVNFIIRT